MKLPRRRASLETFEPLGYIKFGNSGECLQKCFVHERQQSVLIYWSRNFKFYSYQMLIRRIPKCNEVRRSRLAFLVIVLNRMGGIMHVSLGGIACFPSWCKMRLWKDGFAHAIGSRTMLPCHLIFHQPPSVFSFTRSNQPCHVCRPLLMSIRGPVW